MFASFYHNRRVVGKNVPYGNMIAQGGGIVNIIVPELVSRKAKLT
jgi:hypothetical protein